MLSQVARIRSRKPFRPVRANLDHPWGRYLAFFYHYAGGNSFYDAVTQKYVGTTAGISQLNGDVVFGSSARQASLVSPYNPNSVNNQNIMVMGGGILTALPANGRCSMVSYTDSGGNRGAFCGFNSSGFAGGGIFTTNGMIPSVDATSHINQYVTIAGHDGGGGAAGWVNGVRNANNLSGSVTQVLPTQVNIGRDPTAYYGAFTGTMVFGLALTVIPPPSAMPALMANPWQMLEPIPSPLYFFGSRQSGGGGATFKPGWALNATRTIGGVFQ